MTTTLPSVRVPCSWRATAAPDRPAVPPSLFGISFGFAGLSQAWKATGPILGTPGWVPNALDFVGALLLLVVLVVYLRQGIRHVVRDAHDAVVGPFVALAPISFMLLAVGLASTAFGASRILVIVGFALTVAFGGWITGQWVVGEIDPDAAHPGYFLPTVAGGLVGAFCAAAVHLRPLAEASFGIGIISWLLMDSIVLNRLFFRRAMPSALVPTLAIEVAPPAVAGTAYLAISGRVDGPIGAALGGYTVLMAVAQLRLAPVYAKLSFGPGLWAFGFSYAAAVTYGLRWIAQKNPPGAGAYTIALITVISGLVGVLATRTVVAVRRGEFLSPPGPLAPPI
jgi:tellurite resistance protein